MFESKGLRKPFDRSPHTSLICFPDDGIVVECRCCTYCGVPTARSTLAKRMTSIQRVADHNRGRGSAHTAKHRPVKLVYVKAHATRQICLERDGKSNAGTREKGGVDRGRFRDAQKALAT